MINSALVDIRYQPSRCAEELLEIAELYIEAFPFYERRPMRAMAQILGRSECRFFRITLEEKTVGMLHLWELEGFSFCEHFAVASDYRGRGIGEQAMRFALDQFGSVVLEVEPPVDALSARRVAFYGRMGFSIMEPNYLQPQYDASLPPVALYLMACRMDGSDWPSPSDVVHQIHTVVYEAAPAGG